MSDLLVSIENSLRNSLRELLRNKSNDLLQDEHCPHCGLLMTFITARFWLDGDEEFWDIPLPFCLQCHPEIETQINAAG